jgi:hypothetical protein
MPPVTKSVHPIHFEDYDGKQFERLVFAYHLRTDQWRSLEWYGEVGGDLGRDIWGVRQDGSTVCIQCTNRKRVGASKAIQAINKVLSGPEGKPKVFRFICACSVSASSRDKIKAHAKFKRIYECDIFSGTEFEECLRARCESLLKRFVAGIEFPDSREDLEKFVETPISRVAMKKRLEIYQRLYTLWREFKNGLWFDKLRNAASARIRDWFDHNCLYLDARIREEIRLCLNEVGCFQGWKDRNEIEAAEYQTRVIRISKNIEQAADLLK